MVTCVCGDGNNSLAIPTQHPFKISKHVNRAVDRLQPPEVSVEPLPGKNSVQSKIRDKAAFAAALYTWAGALGNGQIPALPSFVSFVSSAVRDTLGGADTARIGSGKNKIVFPGVASCALGVLGCETVRGGPRGPTMMLRRKVAEMYESTMRIAQRGLEMK